MIKGYTIWPKLEKKIIQLTAFSPRLRFYCGSIAFPRQRKKIASLSKITEMSSQWNIQNSSLARSNEQPVPTEKTNSKGNCLEQKTNRKYFKSPKLQMQINSLWNHMLGNAPVKGKEEETKFEAWRIRCLRLLPALACSPAEHSAPGLIHSVHFMEAGELLGLTWFLTL